MRETALETLKENLGDRFSVSVAVLAIVTTLVAAAVGILFATSSNHAEQATSEALARALSASRESDISLRATERALGELERGRGYQALARGAEMRRLLGDGESGSLRLAERRWRALAANVDRSLAADPASADISRDGEASPERDPFFPLQLRARAQGASVEEIALRGAANAEASDWSKRSGSYAAILTLLAVSLYLFGFALTPQGRRLRGLFASAGLAFLLLCVIFGPVRALSSPERAPDEAASAYAEGVVAMNLADDRDEYAAAVDAFDRAIELRPDFAEAYEARADARFLAESPQFATIVSLTSPEALREEIRDVRMARQLGVRTPSATGGLGFALFTLSLLQADEDLLAESIALTREAVAADPDEAIFKLNLGVALLAANDITGAREAYSSGIETLIGAADQTQSTTVLSGALTDLELVALYGPLELADEIRQLRELLVGSVDRGKAGPGESAATVSSARVTIEPGIAQFFIDEATGLERGDQVSAQWYHLDPGGIAWSHLAQLSFPMTLSDYGAGVVGQFSEYTSSARRCLPDGAYRVDLYQDGVLLGQAETVYRGDFKTFLDRDNGVIGCIPRGWEPDPRTVGRAVRVFPGPDRTSGVLIARLAGGSLPGRIGGPLQARKAIDAMLRAVGPTYFGGSARYAGPIGLNFLGRGLRARYTYDGGEILAGAAGDADGSLVVALVFAPPRAFSARVPVPPQIIASMSLASLGAAPER